MSKTVLITGASSGIGKATAVYFQKQGWNVAATMRKPENEQTLNKLQNVKCYRLDVLDSESIEKAISDCISDFGQIDVLVNNAGYGVTGIFEAASDEQIKRQFDTNVFGLMRVSKAVIPHFRNNKSGIIINVASMGGRLTFPLYSIYHGTKWAVEGFSESLHYELRPFGIGVKIIEPGAIKTDFYDRSADIINTDDFPMYSEYAKKVMANSAKAGEKGEKPEVVAKTIFKAATDKSKKMRYPVGNPAPALLGLRKRIPDSWYFSIVRSQVEK
jgi:short-subunit dehydrogenase